MKRDIIGIPIGTRLISLVLVETDEGIETQMWIARRQLPNTSEWQGTYIRVEPSGRVTRVTIDDQKLVADDEFIIKEGKRHA